MGQRRFRALSAFVAVTVLAASAASVVSVGAQPLGTAFPYQGRLQDNSAPANGLYDFQFQIFDAAVGGGQVGPTIVREDVAVSGGLFTTSLDFGGGVFTGSARWLEIAVRPGASGGAFTPIGGRQELQPTPNALFAAATGSIVPPVTLNLASNAAVLTATSTGDGNADLPNANAAIAASINNTNSRRPALKGEINTNTSQAGTAGVFGLSSGTAGYGGFFRASRTDGNSEALHAQSDGGGAAIGAVANNDGDALYAIANGSGEALGAISVDGTAILASIVNAANANDAVTVSTNGMGNAVNARVNNTNALSSAVKGEINTQFSSQSTAAVYGVSTGLGGYAGSFVQSNPAGAGNGLLVQVEGNGSAIQAIARQAGEAVEAIGAGTGTALYAVKPGTATGRVIRASNTNANNTADVVLVENSASAIAHTTLRAVDTGGREARLATNTHAGYFVGDVHVTGNLTKGSGAFKIDHPLDPANKYLSHSFVESPDMKNVYDGVAMLDANGEASVTLPHYFEALNRDFRYQLTAVGGPAPSLHVASKINNGVFRIAGGTPGLEISWQITGIRKDPTALHDPIVVEEDKTNEERGFYLNPAAYGLPAEKGMGWRPREERPTAAPNQQ
jgi:hypothetical protein